MKKYKFFTMAVLVVFVLVCMTGCGEEKQPELADGKFIKLSNTPMGEMSIIDIYTLNIEVHQDKTVIIYADDFDKWLGEGECPIVKTSITDDEINELKQLIADNDLYNMREDIGNKNVKDGDKKSLTLYTVNGGHTSGGMNPSNRKFLKIYDYLYELVREEVYSYKLDISDLQEDGASSMNNQGIRITDYLDNIVLTDEYIDEIRIASYSEQPQVIPDEDSASETDAFSNEDTEDEAEEKYCVAIVLNAEGTELMCNLTLGCEEKPGLYYLYLHGTYRNAISVGYNITDGIIYLNEAYTREQAEAEVQVLSETIK